MAAQLIFLAAFIVSDVVVGEGGLSKPPLSARPSLIPLDGASTLNVFISPAVGESFQRPGAADALTCRLHSQFWTKDVSALWLNRSAVLCKVPLQLSPAASPGSLDVLLNGSWNYSAGGRAPINFSTLMEVTMGRRTYLSNQSSEVEVLAMPDVAAIREHVPNTEYARVCWALSAEASPPGFGGCGTVPLQSREAPATAISFSLDGEALPEQLETEVVITVTLEPSGYILPMKKRRLSVASAAGVHGSFVTVDHRRRTLALNGSAFISIGFYTTILENLFQRPPSIPSNHTVHRPLTMQEILDVLTALAQQGINHLQMYGMEELDDVQLAVVLRHMETHNLHFTYSLVGAVVHVMNATRGFNSTGTWEALIKSASRVMQSPALLGWYICDDCNGYTTTIYEPDGLAKIYTELKKFDPYHITAGATWSLWSSYIFAESGGNLSLDYPLLENYINPPALHAYSDTERLLNRVGFPFEPMANSPGMYDMLADESARGATNHGNFPAVVESTLCWASVITYRAVAQVNFLVDLRPWSKTTINWDHIDEMAAYGRSVQDILPALLPDVTTRFASEDALPVAVLSSTFCNSTQLPAFRTHPAQVVGSSSVAVLGVRQPGDRNDTDCGVVVLINLCSTPTQFAIEIHKVPAGVEATQHQAANSRGALYDVPLVPCRHPQDGCQQLSDSVDGYSSAVFKLGCGKHDLQKSEHPSVLLI